MDFNKLAKQIYQANIKKGFWKKKGDEGQRLFLVITELSEMCEANRIGYACSPVALMQMELLGNTASRLKYFKEKVKDSEGDELADAFIRMLDYYKGFGLKISEARINSYIEHNKRDRMKNLGAELLKLSGLIGRIYAGEIKGEVKKETKEMLSDYAISRMIWIAQQKKIHLEKHVEYKMWYNATRPKMHNKKY
jgi:hypothetical protein